MSLIQILTLLIYTVCVYFLNHTPCILHESPWVIGRSQGDFEVGRIDGRNFEVSDSPWSTSPQRSGEVPPCEEIESVED